MGRSLTIAVLLFLLHAVMHGQSLQPMPSVIDLGRVDTDVDICADLLLVNGGERGVTIVSATGAPFVRLDPTHVNVPSTGSASVTVCLRFTEPGYHDLTVDLRDPVGSVCSVRLTAFAERADVTSVQERSAISGTSIVRTSTGWVVRHPMGAARPFPLDVYTYRGERVARIEMTLGAGTVETVVPATVAIDVRHILVPVRPDATAAP